MLEKGSEQYLGRIFSDTFIGKIGEIAFKKFAKEKFKQEINLDWDISTAIDTYKSDIVGSKQNISIKSTDTLESIWAEAPKPAKYGVFVKVALPKDFFMKILAHISSLKKLLRFVEERLDAGDGIRDLLKFIEATAYSEEMTIKAYVNGFFETSEHTLRRKGLELPWLGEVHEDKHLMRGNVPKVVEKRIGISYPIEKPNKKEGGYTDEERIPQRAGIDHARAGGYRWRSWLVSRWSYSLVRGRG
jgi:hypothetical protein